MKKAMRAVSSILFCLMFIVTSVLVVMKFMGETPNLFGYSMYYILTGSMEPELEAGDIIIGKKVLADELEIGDVVTYQGVSGQTKDKIITHEIVAINTVDGVSEFITKGTANDIEDPPVSTNQIISKMVFKVPLLGDVFSVVNSRIGFLLIIIVPLGVLLTCEIISLVKACKNYKEEQQVETDDNKTDQQN